MSDTTLFLAFTFLAFLFTISVHESAHALIADRCGDPTGRLAGRISLNPLRHIEIFGTIVLPVLTAISGLPTIGWAKPTPVQLANLRNPRRDDILVSIAGPASNILTAGGCLVILFLLRLTSDRGAQVVERLASTGATGPEGLLSPLAYLVHRLLAISIILGIFNLLPIPPLDGSHVLHQLLPAQVRPGYRAISRFGFVILLLIFWYTPLDRWMFDNPLRLVNNLLRM